jgi:hypothetical protein
MKTIATFTKPEEAHLLRMRLEAAGFEAFIQDENMIQLDLLASNAMGGVRLQVADSDFEPVRQYLIADAGEAPTREEVHCPRCNSAEVEYESFSRRFAYLSLILFGLPLLLFRRRLRCSSCLHTWKPG